MTVHSDNFLEDTIDKIEASYEFMLAYAAQGRDMESQAGSGPSIRDCLHDLDQGLEVIAYALAEKIESMELQAAARKALEDFKTVLIEDADRAQEAVRLVLAMPVVTSQLVDNLNASTHLRCLLTDMFLIHESIRILERGAL